MSVHILLIGLRGSGKSTLGARLATRTRRRFVDLDDLTPAQLGRDSVADALRLDGEPAFRRAEVDALAGVMRGPRGVIALGGGTPTAPGADSLLQDAHVIYLRAEPATLRARLEQADNAHRPSLTGAGVLDEIAELFAARDDLYRTLADVVVTIDDLDEDEALSLLVAAS